MDNSSAALFRASNLQILDYPFEAALRSALMYCDEAVVVVGQSEDDTRDMVYGLRDWLGAHRVIVVEETFVFDRMWQEKWWNLASSMTDAEWLFYWDADDVRHEEDVPAIKALMDDPKVNFIRQPFYHFYATKDYVCWFAMHHNTRIGRRSTGYRMVNLCTDETPRDAACAMRFGKNAEHNAHAHMGSDLVRIDEAPIYHYGWCRRARALAISQRKHYAWYADGDGLEDGQIPDVRPHPFGIELPKFLESGRAKPYTGTHPAVMQEWFNEHSEDWDRIQDAICPEPF